ncbi:hypothetical protein OH77DRAFT_1367490, partial [Trametes cingulata]
MPFLLIRPPEDWATGGEPMTASQQGKLWGFHKSTGVDIPFVDYRRLARARQRVTKAEASILISMFEDGLHPSDAYVASLGRSTEPYEPLPHPQFWLHRDDPPSDMQLAWLGILIAKMHVPKDVMQQLLAGVTFGQASLLIEILRKRKGSYWSVESGIRALRRLLEWVRTQLPLGGEDE